MDTTGAKDFVPYSGVSFAQGVIVDHAPRGWSKTMDHEIIVLIKDLLIFIP